jgi:hypothetical protein
VELTPAPGVAPKKQAAATEEDDVNPDAAMISRIDFTTETYIEN